MEVLTPRPLSDHVESSCLQSSRTQVYYTALTEKPATVFVFVFLFAIFHKQTMLASEFHTTDTAD